MTNEVHEKLGVLTAKVDAAHGRVDRLESMIKDHLIEIKADMKELNGYMHRGKGYASAMLFLAGLSGAGLSKLISALFSP
jgi:tetrahydromethanopterin S-methyltransferase subunit B